MIMYLMFIGVLYKISILLGFKQIRHNLTNHQLLITLIAEYVTGTSEYS